jgi:hypothetical protein
MLEEHQLYCLHVGQETHFGAEGAIHSTVAIFGK